jgi:hypothetical protein
MSKIHATGSAVTYGRRYLLMMIFNLSIGDRDDDGNGAGTDTQQQVALTAAQIEELHRAIVDAGADINRFCRVYGIEQVADLPADKLIEAKGKLLTFKRRQQEVARS